MRCPDSATFQTTDFALGSVLTGGPYSAVYDGSLVYYLTLAQNTYGYSYTPITGLIISGQVVTSCLGLTTTTTTTSSAPTTTTTTHTPPTTTTTTYTPPTTTTTTYTPTTTTTTYTPTTTTTTYTPTTTTTTYTPTTTTTTYTPTTTTTTTAVPYFTFPYIVYAGSNDLTYTASYYNTTSSSITFCLNIKNDTTGSGPIVGNAHTVSAFSNLLNQSDTITLPIANSVGDHITANLSLNGIYGPFNAGSKSQLVVASVTTTTTTHLVTTTTTSVGSITFHWVLTTSSCSSHYTINAGSNVPISASSVSNRSGDLTVFVGDTITISCTTPNAPSSSCLEAIAQISSNSGLQTQQIVDASVGGSAVTATVTWVVWVGTTSVTGGLSIGPSL